MVTLFCGILLLVQTSVTEPNLNERIIELEKKVAVINERSEKNFTFLTYTFTVIGLVLTLLAIFGFVFAKDYKETVKSTARNTVQDEVFAKKAEIETLKKEIEDLLKNCKKYEEDAKKAYEKLNTYSEQLDETVDQKDGITQTVLEEIASMIRKSKDKKDANNDDNKT